MNIGINKNMSVILALFLGSSLSLGAVGFSKPEIITQTSTDANASYSAIGQSFVWDSNATLTDIEVLALENDTYDLVVHSGAQICSNAATNVLTTKNGVAVTNTPAFPGTKIALDNNLSLINGDTYTFCLYNTTGDVNLSIDTGNSYSGGDYSSDTAFVTGEDLAFKLYGMPAPDVEFRAITSEDVNSTFNYPSANIAGDSIVFGDLNNTSFEKGWRFVYTLTNGAKFAEGNYTIEAWAGGAGYGDNNDSNPFICTTTGGCSTLDFTIIEKPGALAGFPLTWYYPRRYGLSGADINAQSVNFVLPRLGLGKTIEINVEVIDDINISKSTASIKLFQYTENLVPTPTPTPEPEPTPTPKPEQLLASDADKLDTGIEKVETTETDESFTVKFKNEDGEETEITIPKLEGRTIFSVESSGATEFQMDDAIASYNDNGTTEAQVLMGDKNTTTVSYIPGTKVEFTEDGGVKTTTEVEGTDGKSEVEVETSSDGSSSITVTNGSGKSTKSDNNIPGTQIVIKEDGSTEIDTPSVLSDKGNEIGTKTTIDADGNILVSATKTLPNGDIVEVPLGTYDAGTEVKVEFIDGRVVVEVITTLGTQSFTLRSGRR